MVDVVVTSGTTDLTWNNNAYTWDSVPPESTWDSCYITGHNIVAEYDLLLTDSYSRSISFVKSFSETFDINDHYIKESIKEFTESLNIKDTYVQNSNSVLYDVVLRSAANVDLNRLRSLAKQAHIAGYEDAVEFLPGDYELKEAIIGVVLTNNSANKKVGFKELGVFVDTPDIIDRGTIEITNSGANYDAQTGYTTVYLNKSYHFVPNITATVVSGNTLAEPIFDPLGFTNESFRVKLVVSSGGSSVTNTTLVLGGGTSQQTTGTLLWKAVGY